MGGLGPPTAFSICDACALCSQALYWFNYELVKSWLSGLGPKDRTSVGISFVAGGVSGTVSGLAGGKPGAVSLEGASLGESLHGSASVAC